MNILDYSIEHRSKNFWLYKGKWASFNKSYMEFIEREIQKVNHIAVYLEQFNLTDIVLEKGKELQSEGIFDDVKYAEYPYNIYLHRNFDYLLLDREKGQQMYKSVEFADLYSIQDKALIHVKIGSTPDLRYCIQQSSHSAEIFNTQSDVLEVHGINEVENITMLFVLNTNNMFTPDEKIDFSKNNSIYFKVEIIEWVAKIRNLGYSPRIIIAKDLRTNKNDKKSQLTQTTLSVITEN
jgi:hypothetical protein